jgi:hypothetical protein
MVELQHVILLLGLFALRFVLPLAALAGLRYVLIRLDERWQAEAGQQHLHRPAAVHFSGPALESDPMFVGVPCWTWRDCDPAQRTACPAWLRPELPCWLARMKMESQLPPTCPTCPAFEQMIGRD